MRKSLLIACSLIALPLLADEGAFSFWGDLAYYRRSEGNNRRLIIDEGHGKKNSCGGCNFDSCDARKLIRDFDYEPGFEVGLAFTTHHSMFEVRYLWVTQWESSCSKSDIGELYFSEDHPNITQDFSGADHATAKLISTFQNGEMNYFWFLNPRRADYFSAGWLVGLRYEDVVEHLDIEFENQGDKSPYKVHVNNHIPVVQAGGTVAWNPTSYLYWDLTVKVGIGFDWYRQHTYLGDLNNSVVVLDYNASGFSTPFLGAAALSLTYQPWRFINLHAAYGLIYLNGIALAPDQVHKNLDDRRALGNDQALYHGFTVGVMFSF